MAERFPPAADQDYYTSIGVDHNASFEDIKKAINMKTKQYHPDSQQSLTDIEDQIKELNKIRSVLLNVIEKRKYDEDLFSKPISIIPLFMKNDRGEILLPPAPRHSEKYKSLFKVSKRQFDRLKSPKNAERKDLDEKLSEIVCELPKAKSLDKNGAAKKVTLRKKRATTASITESINANRFSTVDSDYCDIETIRLILNKMCDSRAMTKLSGSSNGMVPLVETNKISGQDLQNFCSLFVSASSPESPYSDNEIRQQLSRYIPSITVQAPPPSSKVTSKQCSSCSQKSGWFSGSLATCYWCDKPFCKRCPLNSSHFMRIGLQPRDLCHHCVESQKKEDIDDWVKTSLKYISDGSDESIIASFGCATVAMALGADPLNLFQMMTKGLRSVGQLDLALNVVDLALNRSLTEGDLSQEIKTHLLAFSVMKDLAKASHKTWEEKWCLVLAAKDAYTHAQSLMFKCNEIDDVSSSGTKEMDVLLRQMFAEQTTTHGHKLSEYVQKLNDLWGERDVLGIVRYMQEICLEANNAVTVIEEDQPLKALQDFIKPKEAYLAQMRPDDSCALLFLMSLLRLKEKKYDSVLNNLSELAWKSSQSCVPLDAIFALYFYMLGEFKDSMFSYTTAKSVLQSGSESLLFSPLHEVSGDKRSKHLLFPSKKELTPPFTQPNWPHLSVCGHNTKCHEKYEEAVMKLYNEKKWSCIQVAWAYLDQIPGCDHPAEKVVCSLHAAMWLAMKFERNCNPAVAFALKCVIMDLLTYAFAVSVNCLNPGMELYALRLAIGILRKMAQSKNSKLEMTEKDHSFIKILMERLLKASRSFPFWEIPSVSVSEAVMLSIVTRRLYGNYLLDLQEVKETDSPLNRLEITYQIYECDLLGRLSLENPSDSRARAMEELLTSQKWRWDEVEQLMSSPLTPRDKDGWFIQSPFMGVQLEYLELTGFRINLDPDHPSIQLLVIRPDKSKGEVGLFSLEDVNAILQLDKSDLPLYFSLDPPNDDLDKRFHPFQKWRYATDKVKDTEILKTMFMTDYLMKSFTVGSDVSSHPPFHQRPCREGLTKDLPQHLQKALRSVHERGEAYSHNTHRFWIESGEMKFDSKQDGSVIEFSFGEIEMKVESHSMLRRSDGKLDDTDEDDDPSSPHATFARDMTEHYRELSHYFPLFARLRQLSKLQTFYIILQSVLQNIEESSREENVEIPQEVVKSIQDDAKKQRIANVSEALDKTKESVGEWPRAGNRHLVQSKAEDFKRELREKIREEEARLYRIHGYNINIDNSEALGLLDNVESQVINALRESDDHTLSQVVEALQEGFNIPQRNSTRLSQLVQDWLSSNNNFGFLSSRLSQTPKDVLVSYICPYLPIPSHSEIKQVIIKDKQQKYRILSNMVSRYKKQRTQKASDCKWVPAAVCSQSQSISYGGVAFNVNIVPVKDGERLPRSMKQTAIPLLQTRSYNSTSTTSNANYTAQRGHAKPKNSSSGSSEGGSNSGSSGRNSSSGNDKTSSRSTKLPREAAAAATNSDEDRSSKKVDTQTINRVAMRAKPKPPVTATTTEKTSRNVKNSFAKFSETQYNQALQSSTNLSASKSRGFRSSNSSRGPPGGSGGAGRPPGGPKGPRGPVFPIRNIVQSLNLPEGTKISSGDPISGPGLYVLESTTSNNVYVGRSCDVQRRIKEHENDMRNQEKTVGKHFRCGEVKVHSIGLNRDVTLAEMRFNEQKLMDVVTSKGYDKVNAIRAMNLKHFQKIESSR